MEKLIWSSPWQNKLTVQEKNIIQNRNAHWKTGPEGKEFDNNDGIRSHVFGPILWTFLGCIGRNYPISPTYEDKQHYLTFLLSLKHVLPCKACRKNFDKNMTQAGFDPEIHLDSRQAFSRFINLLHNIVSKMLHKNNSNFSYERHRCFYEVLKAKCTVGDDVNEGGCDSPRDISDPKPTAIVLIWPEHAACEWKDRHENQSVVIDEECIY